MKLSIIVPCLNEEQVIQQFFEAIQKEMLHLNQSYELLFIDDGSMDQTIEIIQSLAHIHEEVSYVSFSKNFGKEAAMLAGLTYASGDLVVIMDADLQHPPKLLGPMLQKQQEGYDQVIAKRSRTGDAKARTLLSQLYYKLVNGLMDVKLEDGVGDFRLLSRRAVDALLSLQEYNRFSKGLFSWIGFEEAVIEYENVVREEGQSKWSFRSLLNYGVDGILSFNNKPLRIAIYLGLSITVASLLYVVVMLFSIIFNGIDVPGYFTTLAGILFLGGIQLFFLGIIGEYIGRIYYEVKRRPHYIIADKKTQKK